MRYLTIYSLEAHHVMQKWLASKGAEPESVGHIQSAHCLGQVDTARAAHNRCAVQLQHDLNRFKAENSSMEFITLEPEQSFGTLWEKHPGRGADNMWTAMPHCVLAHAQVACLSR